MKTFTGAQIIAKAEALSCDDVHIFGIVASHSVKLPSEPGGGDNIIFVVDRGGMRFVHIGDTEQRALTPEQLDALGEVDVAFMEFYIDPNDTYKCFVIMDQGKPKLIIPTHLAVKTPQHAAQRLHCVRLNEKSFTLTHEDLPEETTYIFLMDRAKKFGGTLELEM